MGTLNDLIAYKKSYKLAMDIYNITKKYPKEENMSLISQIRRSSRSVCVNLAEAYKRRTSLKYFIAKLNDCETENLETEIWLRFSLDCNYLSRQEFEIFFSLNNEVGKLLWFMKTNPLKFINTENQTLTSEKAAVTVERDQYRSQKDTLELVKQNLEATVNVARTLNAYGIAITPINEKNGKEKITSTAKRVDKLIISFDVDNRIAQTGSEEIFVAITDPDGKPVAVEALGSGSFTTRDEGEKLFTAKVNVDVETGKKKHVEFAWKQNSDFKTGPYKIEIYHNGFKIGEAIKELKKGGLFS